MGCGGSKNKALDPSVIEPDLTNITEVTDQRPKQILKDIDKYYKIYLDKKELLKPLIAERTGLQSLLDDEREKLLDLLVKKDKAYKDRTTLLNITWERDADDIFKAFNKSVDKAILVSILMNRTKWQIEEIAKFFEKKYGKPLLAFVISEMTTLLGTLATGGNTGLAKLLTYRIMPQPERDAALLRDFSDGIGLNEDEIIEIVMTRSNNELKEAMEMYQIEYKKSFYDMVKNKSSYKNFRDFMLKVLECDRDERNELLDPSLAAQFAQELYDAGAGRMIGTDPEPFIRILANINIKQFEQINNLYKGQQLLRDITSKTGGSFEAAIVARCSDKYEFLAKKVDKALKGFSVDKDALCRIFGSLKLYECVRLREAYDRLGFGSPTNPKTLEQSLRTTLSKGNFQSALLDMIIADPTNNPLGSYLEVVDEDLEANNEGERAKKIAEMNYKQDKIISSGESILRDKQRGKLVMNGTNLASDDNTTENTIGNSNIILVVDELDDDVPKYSWDPVRGRFMDASKLAKELKDCQQATKDVLLLKERIVDEINGLKDVYYSIVKSSVEAEVWIRIYSTHSKNLRAYMEKRESYIAASGSKKK